MTVVSSPSSVRRGTATSAARIVFDGWGWRYADRDAWAVRGVDLTVEPGERVAIVGPSGAGKSTLLRAVAGVLPDEPDATDDTAASVQGSVLVDGAEPPAVEGYERIVFMFDGYDAYQLEMARNHWKRLKTEGHALTYWQQSPEGRWQKKA